MRRSDAHPAGLRLGRRALLSLGCLATLAAAALAFWPRLSPRLGEPVEAAADADGRLLLLGGVLFAAAPAGCGLVWREALARAGGRLGRVDACARYGVGSLVNSFVPAHAGDVVRTALMLEALPAGRRRAILPCLAIVQVCRAAVLVGFVLAASLPLGPAPAVLALVALAVIGGLRPELRTMLSYSAVALVAKVAAVAAVLTALAVPSPVQAAFAVVPALEIAAMLALTPGNLGLASAAGAVALNAGGLSMHDAIAAGILIHAVETAAGVSYGVLSTMYVARPTGGRTSLQIRGTELVVAASATLRRRLAASEG